MTDAAMPSPPWIPHTPDARTRRGSPTRGACNSRRAAMTTVVPATPIGPRVTSASPARATGDSSRSATPSQDCRSAKRPLPVFNDVAAILLEATSYDCVPLHVP